MKTLATSEKYDRRGYAVGPEGYIILLGWMAKVGN